MKPIKVLGMFNTIKKENYGDVPIWYGANADGDPTMITAYELSDQERLDIEMGKPIFLHIMGIYMPSVYLSTENPLI